MNTGHHLLLREHNDLLRKLGYRLTPQRALILRLLQEAQAHLSIEQLLEGVQQYAPSINLTTIYRTLDLLQEVGLIHKAHLPGKPATYELVNGRTHHHLICRQCHSVIHLSEALQEELVAMIESKYRFRQVMLDITSVGYCEACWEKHWKMGVS